MLCQSAQQLIYGALFLLRLQYTVLHCTALHCTALHCTAEHGTARHGTAMYCTALLCTDSLERRLFTGWRCATFPVRVCPVTTLAPARVC